MTTNNKKILDVYFVTAENYGVREETLDGKPHLVVPVTMMVEGVHSGSHGPILHYAEDLGRYPESWNGIPVTISHPKVNGTYVSANSPDVLADWAVGRVFNTSVTDNALKAEAWLCIEDLERVSEVTLNKINDREIIEVSVGIFSDEEETSGFYNNEQYVAIARNHRPDHLALLPDEIGACSIEDGCGVRVNTKGGTKVTQKTLIVTNENRNDILRELNQQGFSVNEMGQFRKAEEIRHAVYGLDRAGKSYYVEEIFDEYVIFAEHDYNVNPSVRKFYQQDYLINAAGQAELTGEAVQVTKEINYPVISAVSANNKVKTERTIQKNSNMCKECVKNLVNGLIANKTTAYNETHRTQLEALPEELLEIMSQNSTIQANAGGEQKISRADILSVLSKDPLTRDEYLSILSPEERAQTEAALQLHADQKKKLVKGILDNSKVWEETELNGKEVSELQKIHSVVANGEQIEYVSGAGGMQTNGNNGGRAGRVVMLPPNVNFKKD